MPFTTKPGLAPAGELPLAKPAKQVFFVRQRRAVRAGFTHFARQSYVNTKPNGKKGDPPSGSFRFATGNLCCSTPAAVQTTRLRLKQVWPDLPPPSALLGPASTGWGHEFGIGEPQARSAWGESLDCVPKTLGEEPRSAGPDGSATVFKVNLLSLFCHAVAACA